MCFKYIFILFFILIFTSESAFSQLIPAKKDTTLIYSNIEKYSKRSSFTKFVYSLIFKPRTKKTSKQKQYKKLIKKPYSSFEGKIIRNINIETMDPFGYSIEKNSEKPQNFILKTGNKLHARSQHITIRNLLLFRQNKPFDSLLVKESERLVRSRRFVRDVSFNIKTTSKQSDSVDIFIRELDNWSLYPDFSASTSSNTVVLTDNNFLGSGHEFQNAYTKNIANGQNAFSSNYFIPNIYNTYINTRLLYEIDGNKNFNKGFTIDRPFYSPLAKWAGGVSIGSTFKKEKLLDSNLEDLLVNFKFNTYDYWVGHAFQLFKGNTVEERTTNLITTARYLRVRYSEKPPAAFDPLIQYSNEDFYLAGIGLSTRKYVQDKYIFKYGITEDVPVGKVLSLTGGYQVKNKIIRPFLGARISAGNYYPWGYLSTNFEYETFFNEVDTEQGNFTAGINYFTGLFEIGKWKFRQFAKPEFTIGINRFAYDSLTLNDGFGLDGFKSKKLSGTSRLLLTLQTQAYAPWNLWGFRLGPFLTCSLGMLGNAETGFKNKKIYSQIGFGVLIKNDNLIFNTFQFSISFYPTMPGNGQNVFKSNAFQTTDFGFSDFQIGKPASKVFK